MRASVLPPVLSLALAVSVPALAAPTKPATAAKPANWAETYSVTPAGGLLIGNPNARVKLIEFGSFSCNHCRDFHAAAMPALKAKYLARGQVSFEFRSFVRNGADFGASLVAQCLPAKQAYSAISAFFGAQDQWLAPYAAMTEAQMAAINAAPDADRPRLMAREGKLAAFVAPLGLDAARVEACLSAKPAADRLLAIRNEAINVYGLEGTPTLVINGKTVAGVFTWAELEPRLIAAVAGK
jgi:protein-disulfide isomerase